jgi:hypothetical protein
MVLVASGIRTFQIIVANVLYLLAEPDRGFRRPDSVRIESETVVAIESAGDLVVTLQLVLRSEDAPLQFVRGESVAVFQLARVGDQLLDGSHFA